MTDCKIHLLTTTKPTLLAQVSGGPQGPQGPSGTGIDVLTTKGDLVTYTTVVARLPVGTDGQVLTALASDPNGVAWLTVKQADRDPTVLNTTTTGLPGTLQHTWDFSVPVDGNYLVEAHFMWSANTASDDIFVSVLLNSTMVGYGAAGSSPSFVSEGIDSAGDDGGTGSETNQRYAASVKDELALTQAGNPHTLELYVSGSNSAVCTVYGSLFTVELIP